MSRSEPKPATRREFLGFLLSAFATASLTLGTTMSATAQDSSTRPISRAILNRDVAAVRSLVEGGEDIDQRLFNRDTPAIMAATSDSWDIVLYLLKAGANPALENRKGVTVASMAKTSRVAPHTHAYKDLTEVKKILSAKGLL